VKRIFVHIPKTGGNTIQRSTQLRDVLVKIDTSSFPPAYVKDQAKAMSTFGLSPQLDHCRWRDLAPEFTRPHGAVAIVRNPWDKVVSQYLFALKIDREHTHHPKNTAAIRAGTTFEEFIAGRHRWGLEPYFWHRTTVGWYPQLAHVTDDAGYVRCDILRFEHHAAETMAYFGLDRPLAKRNVTDPDRADYRTFYTPRTQREIGEWFVRDVDYFGFTFDTGATRGTWAT